MDKKIDDGSSAFPTKLPPLLMKNDKGEMYSLRDSDEILPGMSLRDWFAGQALSAMTAPLGEKEKIAHRASIAYQWADAMLAARK